MRVAVGRGISKNVREAEAPSSAQCPHLCGALPQHPPPEANERRDATEGILL